MFDAHAPVPDVKLLEQVRVDLEEVQRRRVRQRSGLHEAKEHEEVVELGGLAAELALVRAPYQTPHHVGEVMADLAEIVGPAHRPIMTLKRVETPPRSFSLTSFEMPPSPRMP